MTELLISQEVIQESNFKWQQAHVSDYEALGEKLDRQGLKIESLVQLASAYHVAIPSWGVGTGGTRFARFPGVGEPSCVEEKLDDCSVIHQLTGCTPHVSLHIPWDKPENPSALKNYAHHRHLGFDAINSNTFQDQDHQKHSYQFGSLTHTHLETRTQAIEHNLECIEIGKKLGSKALTVWIADGTNFPGQSSFTGAFERYLTSLKEIYQALPNDWLLFLEHKMFEPAFYSTVIQDWGTSYLAATELGEQAKCLVDLGHHAPNVNIEMIVARLAHFGKLGGFHLNDSKYGDDDLDSGIINPYQLFLIFNELREAKERNPHLNPALMLDQSHNVTDPIESLMSSVIETQRAYIQAQLIDYQSLTDFRQNNDALLASETLKQAYRNDVSPILAEARQRCGGALAPVFTYRQSRYRQQVAKSRPISKRGGGIV